MQLFITKNTDEEQRQALIRIFTGQAKGEGPFALFAPTYKYILEPQFVDIKTKVDGRKSSFAVPDSVIDVQLENFVIQYQEKNKIQRFTCQKDSFGRLEMQQRQR